MEKKIKTIIPICLLVSLFLGMLLSSCCGKKYKHKFQCGDYVKHKISQEIGIVVRVYTYYDTIGVRWAGKSMIIPSHIIGSGGTVKETRMYYYEVHEYEVEAYEKD